MMAENNGTGSSQESLLPLSQGTFGNLWNMISLSGNEEMLADLVPNNWDVSEIVPTVEPQPVVHGTRSSLPARSGWPGNYDFKLLFGHQEKVYKNMTWAYSPADNKLFVKKDEPCPFSFQTNTIMPENVFIRAMAVYSSPEFASTVVTRCVNHSQQEIVDGVPHAEHLIRSESHLATYDVDTETKRHSVIVPFENPPVGQDYSMYVFKFVCFSSCPGGPNRRLLTLVFTLEHGSSVLGRITLDLKICASPMRDRAAVEKLKVPEAASSPPAKRAKTSNGPGSSSPRDCERFTKKKKAGGSEEKQEYVIKVKDSECYAFLSKMKKLYQTSKTVNRLPPHYKSLLQLLRSSSDEDDALVSP